MLSRELSVTSAVLLLDFILGRNTHPRFQPCALPEADLHVGCRGGSQASGPSLLGKPILPATVLSPGLEARLKPRRNQKIPGVFLDNSALKMGFPFSTALEHARS